MASDPLPDLLQFRARSRSEPVRVSPEELVARELRRISDEFDSLVFSPTQVRHLYFLQKKSIKYILETLIIAIKVSY